MPGAIDLARLASEKGLPADALRGFGVHNQRGGGVRIEYRSPDGSLARARIRMALGGVTGSRWDAGDLPITAYWRSPALARADRQGRLLLCEGESSCWTAWHEGFAAVGIPGANEIASLSREHLGAADEIVIVVEPDDPQTYPHGRARYRGDVEDRLRAIQCRGHIKVLDLDGVAADLNALYQANPSAFAGRVDRLIREVGLGH